VAYVDFERFYEDDDAEIPVFDKRIARAARDHGVLHETLRTWPGALRSAHPDAGVVALGRLAEWLVGEHPFQYGYGAGSPFERAVQAKTKVLMLGAPLDTITLLHYAEHRARMPDKRIVKYRRLMPGPHGAEWVEFEEFDTSGPVNPLLPGDVFERIARAYLASGGGVVGQVGAAPATLLDGQELVDFAVDWLERWFPEARDVGDAPPEPA
jgi:aminoglycoside 3-N-acetyltransferase